MYLTENAATGLALPSELPKLFLSQVLLFPVHSIPMFLFCLHGTHAAQAKAFKDRWQQKRHQDQKICTSKSIHHPSNKSPGNVAHGQEIEVAGIPVTFQITQYTVWQVSHDPTFGVALVAACLFLAAALVSLWVPHRRLWLRVEGGRVQMVGSGDWGSAFDALAAEIGFLCGRQALEAEAGNDG